jgi:putative tryptophan/tyrosine transport system substrate-binding protein
MAINARIDALYVVSSRLTAQHLDRIVRFAAEHRLPLAGGWGDWARQGGLLSYGPNVDDMIGRAVTYVDRILKGAKPAELPVQQPTKFELTINLKAARMLGLEVSSNVQQLADELIE